MAELTTFAGKRALQPGPSPDNHPLPVMAAKGSADGRHVLLVPLSAEHH